MSERPWISASNVKIVQPLRFAGKVDSPDVAVMGISADLKNAGHSVALNVRRRMALVAQSGNVKDRERTTCEALIKSTDQDTSNAIFPEDSLSVTAANIMQPNEIQKSMAIWRKLNAKSTLTIPLMIFCIDYRFSFSKEPHYSRYAYWVGVPVQGNPGIAGAIIPRGVINNATLILADVTAN